MRVSTSLTDMVVQSREREKKRDDFHGTNIAQGISAGTPYWVVVDGFRFIWIINSH